MNRRDFIKAMSISGAAAAVNLNQIAQVLADGPDGAFQPTAAGRDRVWHLISRMTLGVTPELYKHVQAIGCEAFIEEQLAPDEIDDSNANSILQDFPIIDLSANDLYRDYEGMPGKIVQQLIASWLLRARYSERQLYERMVHFWSDHFNVYLLKGPIFFLKSVDDRDVARAHALGHFRTILGASAHSPAMLVYLDNVESGGDSPNENYARELLELHTLGVHGGYTEDDVKEVARCFTGWSVLRPRWEFKQGEPGTFAFRRLQHDFGEKTVLGNIIRRNGGESDGQQVLDILASHPSTARFISSKLVRRFVADDPPESLVDRCAETFLQTNGSTNSVLRVIFASDEFWDAPPKFKRPIEYSISVLRGLDYQIRQPRRFAEAIGGFLEAMGQIPFLWPAPDGYPDVGSYWMGNLLPRWNLVASAFSIGIGQPNYKALTAMIQEAGITDDMDDAFDLLAHYLIGRSLTGDEHQVIFDLMDTVEGGDGEKAIAGLALLMASPAFQYR